MFASLKIKDFRIYWLGMFFSLIGTWIQTTAQSWLVFQLTNSKLLLGVVGFLSTIPIFVLSLFGGVIADRLNKRSILFFTQHAFMILAFVLAVRTQLKLITPAQIMWIAVLNGIVMAFDAPVRQAMVVELVGKEHLLNAIALNSAAFNSARIIGPVLAGILIAVVGMSGCFYLNGISFLAVITALLLIKNITVVKKNNNTVLFDDLLEGLRFIRDNRLILVLIIMVGITSLFGSSYMILMPVFASDVLKTGVKGLGLLMSSTGVGALLAALTLARLGNFRYKGRFIILSSLIFSLALVLFSLSKTYLASLMILPLIGWASVTAVSLINNSLQILVPDEFRGRVMSVFMLTFAGIMPFGNLLAGTCSQIWGVSLTVMLNGIILFACFISLNTLFPEIRNLNN